MKAISIGDKYQVYGNSLQAYDSIPAYTYNVRFDEMTGFYLKVRSKLAVKEKTYGTHPEKAEKVLRTFSVFERNLGVILSGDKGIGKSPVLPYAGRKGTRRWIPGPDHRPVYPGHLLTTFSP